ncbi:cbb3-type cytochrome c oxidase N-terminal domain-containing protein [soil metagenome]
MSDEEPTLLGHSYDGIQEYDNPLPGWWSMGFWATIVFAFAYVGLSPLLIKTPDQAYRGALAEYAGKKERREIADAKNVSEQVLERDAHDPKAVAKGAAVFAKRCVACHTEDGHGLIGPNLTDLFQIHGSTRMDLFTTIRGGVLGTPMLAWGEQLPPSDVVAVAAFVSTLRGTNIPGKAPQGALVEAFK